MRCWYRRPLHSTMSLPYPMGRPWAGCYGSVSSSALSFLALPVSSCCRESIKRKMKYPQIIPHKIYDLSGLQHQLSRWRLLGKTVSFTNGCFDILHQGHIASLSEAATEADFLI